MSIAQTSQEDATSGIPTAQKSVGGAALVLEAAPDGSPATAGVQFADQAVIAVTGTAVALPSHAMKNGCIVKSLSSNSALRQTTSTNSGLTNAVAGTSGATAGYILDPGEAAPYSASATLTNTNQIYVNGQAGDIFTVIGS